jgi:hypothetical protein
VREVFDSAWTQSGRSQKQSRIRWLIEWELNDKRNETERKSREQRGRSDCYHALSVQVVVPVPLTVFSSCQESLKPIMWQVDGNEVQETKKNN